MNATLILRLLACFVLSAVMTFTPGCSDQPTKKIEQSVQGVFDADISRNGNLALIASIQHGGSLWDIEKGERLYNWNHAQTGFSQLTQVALSPSGLIGLTAQNKDLVFWDSTTGKSFRFWQAPAHITSAAISENNFITLLGLAEGGGLVLDIRNAERTRVLPHDAKITSVSISNDGNYGLTGTKGGFARLWNLNSKKQIRHWKHKFHVNQVMLSPKASYAFTAGQHDKYALWDAQTGDLIFDENNRSTSITAVNFSEEERFLILGNSAREIKLYQLSPVKLLKTWRMPKKTILRPSSISSLSLTYLPDKQLVISATSKGHTYFYDMDQVEVQRK